jgi:hypothetical protein
MYVASSYHLKPEKAQDYKRWLLSAETSALFSRIEDETGFDYVETYFTIYGFGEYACETWWDVADWSVLGNMRESEAGTEWLRQSQRYIDETRPFDSRALRSTSDIMVFDAE